MPNAVVRVDLQTGEHVGVAVGCRRPACRRLPAAPYTATFEGPGGRDVHAHVSAPRNPDARAPVGELPPFIVFVHGGPTASSPPLLNLEHAYFTSRGIGVIDVDYGGSSGYGREYRERLRGQWGIVDVEDCVAAAQALAKAGEADGERLAIRGGSAGGWTTLAALTGTDAFGAGTSYFGVAELLRFAQDTHDFESRYLDGLVGPLPEAHDLYVERAPLSHVDEVACPVLLLQGLDDQIVPPSQAEMFRDALVAKGIRHAYLAFEGEQHGFRKAENVIASLEAELSFYGQVFGFTPPGVPAARTVLTSLQSWQRRLRVTHLQHERAKNERAGSPQPENTEPGPRAERQAVHADRRLNSEPGVHRRDLFEVAVPVRVADHDEGDREREQQPEHDARCRPPNRAPLVAIPRLSSAISTR